MNTQLSLKEKVYRKIRDDITNGKLLPGERILENKLAMMFKVSRSPVREALRHLESEGLIEFKRNKGITVAKLSAKQVDEIYTLRMLLESYATRLSAESANNKDVIYLRNLNAKMKKARKTNDLQGWLENNTLFHNFFSEHCGNTNLNQILNILKRRIYRYRLMVRVPGHFKDYISHHEGIIRSCETNDGKMAERYMRLHLEMVKRIAIEFLNSFSYFL